MTDKYKWVDITDELEPTEMPLIGMGEGTHAIQYRLGEDALSVLFTLVYMPSGMKKFVPGRLFTHGDYRVMIDYTTDPTNGIGAVWKRVPCIEWVNVTHECKPIIKESLHTKGHYGMLTHRGQEIALLGIDGVKLCPSMSSKYKVEKPKNARVSFMILRKVSH